MSIHVNADNFVRAETDRMFRDLQGLAGGPNRFHHIRTPTAIDAQTVIRMNRDTLYSIAIVDLAGGATLTLPDAGERYLSAMVVDNDHYVREIHHEAGAHALTQDAIGTRFAAVAVRTLVDPNDAQDLEAVATLQDALGIEARSSEPFAIPDYDTASLDATRNALLALAAGMHDFDHAFGTPDEVDPIRRLVGAAAGWGGLPTSEAAYVLVDPGPVTGDYELRLADVPADAFWSISVYNAQGFFEANPQGIYTVNSITAVPDADGSVTVRFVHGEPTAPNSIPVPDPWNYAFRCYRPRTSFFDGSWHLPEATPIGRVTGA